MVVQPLYPRTHAASDEDAGWAESVSIGLPATFLRAAFGPQRVTLYTATGRLHIEAASPISPLRLSLPVPMDRHIVRAGN